MDIALNILLGLVALICFLGGANLLIKGAGSFAAAPPPVLDNLFRFLSGIYFGLGFLMTWVVLHRQQAGSLIYCIGLVVVCSGLGRLYSRMKEGTAGKYFDFIMVFELLLGLAIILLQYLLQEK